MSTPAERVTEFIRQYEKQTYPSAAVQTIHGRRHGELLPDTQLLLTDLKAILEEVQPSPKVELLGYAVAAEKEGVVQWVGDLRTREEAERGCGGSSSEAGDSGWTYRVAVVTTLSEDD